MIVVERAPFGHFNLAARSKLPVYRAQENGRASNEIMLTVIAIRLFLRNLASSLASTSGAIGSSSAAGAAMCQNAVRIEQQ